MQDIAKLLLYQQIFLPNLTEEIVEYLPPASLSFSSLMNRLSLSDYLNGRPLRNLVSKEHAAKHYCAEEVFNKVTTCCFLEGSKIVWHKADSSVEEFELREAVSPLLEEQLQAAYLVRWGWFYTELPGEGIIVVSPKGSENFTDLRSCDCEVYKSHHRCEHLAFANCLLRNRSLFAFLGV